MHSPRSGRHGDEDLTQTFTDYDILVIGNGSAGDGIARTLGRKGFRVGLVEQTHLGGECLNDGCVPSKALIDLSKRAATERLGWDEVVSRIRSTQLQVRGTDPNGGLRDDGIVLHWGSARFLSATDVDVDVDGTTLRAKDIVVATGTAPALPPIPGLAEAKAHTNRTIFSMPALPKRLAVIGGGAIGLELGQSFRRLGSDVTIFEAADRIAGTEDAEVSLELTKLLERGGLRLETSIRIELVERNEGGGVTITTSRGRFSFDDILVAAGRSAQVPEGLVEAGAMLDQRGFLSTDACGQTGVPGIWGAGDVTGKFLFTHYAGYQAHHIARHIERDVCEPIPDTVVPWAIFTDPEIGHAGMTEQEARDAGKKIRVAKLAAAELDWFRTTSQTDGFAKVIVDDESGVILGAHFICAGGSTLVGEACLAIQHGLTARQVAETVHPYPTASELFRWVCASAV